LTPLALAPEDIPAFAVWFGSAGFLCATAGLLIGRDDSVRTACDGDWQLSLAELNDHLRAEAIVPNTLTLPAGTLYDIVVDEDDVHQLTQRISRVNGALRPFRVTRRVTAIAIALGVLYVVVGLTMVSFGFTGVTSAAMTATSHLVVWIPLSLSIALALAVKAYIFVTRCI